MNISGITLWYHVLSMGIPYTPNRSEIGVVYFFLNEAVLTSTAMFTEKYPKFPFFFSLKHVILRLVKGSIILHTCWNGLILVQTYLLSETLAQNKQPPFFKKRNGENHLSSAAITGEFLIKQVNGRCAPSLPYIFS